MWRQVVAQSPGENAPAAEVLRYDVGWKALNTMLKSGRSLSGHERNCCYLNTQGKRFANISAASSLDFDDDGRVLALSDWDNDGDVDFWIANRTGPQLRFMRNDAANEHNFVAFKLSGVKCNRDAIGARIELHVATEDHPVRSKTLRAGEGYLAQSSKWLTFGLGEENEIASVIVHWPDGTSDTVTGVEVNQRYSIRQGAAKAELSNRSARKLALAPSTVTPPKPTDKSRVVLISPIPIPSISYEDFGGKQVKVDDTTQPRLINFWATWCQPCVEELAEWNQHRSDLAANGVRVLALNVDEPEKYKSAREEQKEKIETLLTKISPDFEGGFASSLLLNKFDVLQRSILRRQRPMPIPTSFLVDARGNLRVIYKGPVDVSQIIADAKLLEASPEETVAASTPYVGKWLGTPGGTSPNTVAIRFLEGGYAKEAESYLRKLASAPLANPMYKPTEAMVLLGAICADQGRYTESAEAFEAAVKQNPEQRQAHVELGRVYTKLKKHAEAATHYRAALKRRQDDPELRFNLAMSLQASGATPEAIEEFRRANELRPTALTHHHLGNALIGIGKLADSIEHFEDALRLQPKFNAAANNLAWILATQKSLLNAERALEVAKSMVENSPHAASGELDTLAAAYAASGSFDDAVATAEKAMELAKSAGDQAKADRIAKRLELYRQQQPYVE